MKCGDIYCMQNCCNFMNGKHVQNLGQILNVYFNFKTKFYNPFLHGVQFCQVCIAKEVLSTISYK